MSETILKVKDLKTRFYTDEGQVNAVENVSFTVNSGEVIGIVGESGSGKSVTALSLMDLIEKPGQIVDGEIWYRNELLAESAERNNPKAVDGTFVDLLKLSKGQRRELRGSKFSMIFQDPMSSFNPSYTVGEQIGEAVEVQKRADSNPRSTGSRTKSIRLSKFIGDSVLASRNYVSEASRKRAIELLAKVGIPDPKKRAKEYPHQFSGGMLQRAMIAQALAGEPDVLVADEPTTALDVTIQAQILNLLFEIQESTDMSIVLITHDLGVVSRMCDRVGVMYAGEIVERGPLEKVLDNPVHPYTKGLLGSVPNMSSPETRLEPIPGNVPDLIDDSMDDRCYFADRCPKAMDDCLSKPAEYPIDQNDNNHQAMCHLVDLEYRESKALPDGYFDSPEQTKSPNMIEMDGGDHEE